MYSKFLTVNFLLLILCVSLSACREVPTLKGFNSKAWQEDRLGCKGLRTQQIQTLLEQRDKLKGLGQNQVMAILGKPDFQELASRNQRFYIYYYQKGKQCEEPTISSVKLKTDRVLRIRFSALDSVNEITN
jgi:hypothetical protein